MRRRRVDDVGYGRPSCPAPHRYLESADRGTRLTYQPVLEYGKGRDGPDVVICGQVDPDDVPERAADGAHEGRDGREREEALVSNEGVPDLDHDGLAYGSPRYTQSKATRSLPSFLLTSRRWTSFRS